MDDLDLHECVICLARPDLCVTPPVELEGVPVYLCDRCAISLALVISDYVERVA